MLTVKELESLSREEGRHSVGDGSGLHLYVRNGGRRRQWVQRVTIGGKRPEFGHGDYPAVSLSKARELAKKVCDAIAAGRDPRAERSVKKAKDKAAVVQTLDAALTAYIEAHGPAWKSAKTRKQTRESLEKHAGALLKKPARDIAMEDIRTVLAPIWAASPAIAVKVRSRLEAVLDWAIAAGWRGNPNPALWKGGLQFLLAKPSAVARNQHHPALPWEQMAKFMAELRDENGTAPRCLELAILAAGRSGEAREAVWGEIDLNAAVWTIPWERMKEDEEHRVPLSASAIKLLRSMLPAGGKPSPKSFVFPNTKGKAHSDMSLLAVVKRMHEHRMNAEGIGWCDKDGRRITPHGFRSAFRDWAGDNDKNRDLAEMSLAHAVGDETERAYRRSDLLARRAKLMAEWAAHCDGNDPPAATAPLPVRIVAAA